MFETRPKNKEIDFMYFGAAQKMPSGEIVKNGDSVRLQYKQYDVVVEHITAITETSFSGTVDSISNKKSGEEVREIGVPLNIRLNDNLNLLKTRYFIAQGSHNKPPERIGGY